MKNEKQTVEAEWVRGAELLPLLGLKSLSGLATLRKVSGFPQPKRFSTKMILYNREAVLNFVRNFQG